MSPRPAMGRTVGSSWPPWIGGAAGANVTAAGADALIRLPNERKRAWTGGWSGAESRGPNYSHGTAGIASALAVAGVALGLTRARRSRSSRRPAPLDIGTLDDGGLAATAHHPAVEA